MAPHAGKFLKTITNTFKGTSFRKLPSDHEKQKSFYKENFPLDLNFFLSPTPGPTQVRGESGERLKLPPKQKDPAEQRAEGLGVGGGRC